MCWWWGWLEGLGLGPDVLVVAGGARPGGARPGSRCAGGGGVGWPLVLVHIF